MGPNSNKCRGLEASVLIDAGGVYYKFYGITFTYTNCFGRSHKSNLLARGGSRKKIYFFLGGGWPLIIWEATTSRTTCTVSNCPVLSNLCTVITLKI